MINDIKLDEHKPCAAMDNRWDEGVMRSMADKWFKKLSRQKRTASEYSALWWYFCRRWSEIRDETIAQFLAGDYHFAPMRRSHFPATGRGDHIDNHPAMWDYQDRMLLHIIMKVLKPTLKHVVPDNCLHMKGPAGVKPAIARIQQALGTQRYQYVMRLDIKSYFASIDRDILMRQIRTYFDDPWLLQKLDSAVNHLIDDGGVLETPKKGIPRRSSLSNFLGALYLAELDKIFANAKGCFYVRFQDDIVILIETKRQYVRAKKRMAACLDALKLTLSPRKTWMGQINEHTFHDLGVQFSVSQNRENKTQTVTVTMHNRSCRRALDNVNAMVADAVHPAETQRYLLRWAVWWSSSVKQFTVKALLTQWLSVASAIAPTSQATVIGATLLCRAELGLLGLRHL